MEHLTALLSQAARAAMLELEVPLQRLEQEHLKKAAKDLKTDLDWARLEAKNLEEPSFFLRLLGKAEEKLEKARAEARTAAAAHETARRELETLTQRLEAAQTELDSLQGVPEAYTRERAAFLQNASHDQLQLLREQETDAFRPAAILTVRQIRNALQNAHPSMARDVRTKYDGTGCSRKLEFLDLADDYAEKLQALLVYFPENGITLGASLTRPSAYVCSASMDYAQLDRLNIAIEQSRRVQKQLEDL